MVERQKEYEQYTFTFDGVYGQKTICSFMASECEHIEIVLEQVKSFLEAVGYGHSTVECIQLVDKEEE